MRTYFRTLNNTEFKRRALLRIEEARATVIAYFREDVPFPKRKPIRIEIGNFKATLLPTLEAIEFFEKRLKRFTPKPGPTKCPKPKSPSPGGYRYPHADDIQLAIMEFNGDPKAEEELTRRSSVMAAQARAQVAEWTITEDQP